MNDDGQRASQLCLTPCKVTNGGAPFWLSGANTGNPPAITVPTSGANFGTAAPNCASTSSFLLIANGQDSATPTPNVADRFCGGNLASVAAGTTTTTTICSKLGMVLKEQF